MSGESTVSKNSFFKDYFRHKLRNLNGFTITFAALNFALLVGLATIAMHYMITERNRIMQPHTDYIYIYGGYEYWMFFLLILLVFLAELILLSVMAAINFKFYHSRSAMDTIGGLPLTVTERFWGDFLSGVASFMISFIPCSAIALIMMAITQFGVVPDIYNYYINKGDSIRYVFPAFKDNLLIFGLLVVLTLLICLAAAYAVTCFVTSLCGRLDTAIIFSLTTQIAVPLAVGTFGSFIFTEAVGVVETTEIACAVNMLPPFGTFYYVLWSYYLGAFRYFELAVATPKVIVMLAFVVLPIIGAYLIAKNRKAERVDKPLIYRSAYAVITMLISITAVGLVLAAWEAPGFTVPVIAFTIAACIFIEYIRSHSKRTFWKGLVKFAAAVAVCAVFAAITRGTRGFNMGYKLPEASEIESVEIYGTDILREIPSNKFTDEGIISAVLSENKKLTDNLDKFEKKGFAFVNRLTITYNLKNGGQVERSYEPGTPDSKRLLTDFAENIINLPEIYNMTSLGIINSPDTTCVSIEVYDSENEKYSVIDPSAHDEFTKCLRNDLLNRPADNSAYDQTSMIYVRYNYINSYGTRNCLHINIKEGYKETDEFLSDPDNYSSSISVEIDESTDCRVSYYAQDIIETLDITPTLTAYFTADDETAREFISYLETDYTVDGDYSRKFSVTWGSKTLKIKTENEYAALKALFKIISEQ